MCLHMGYNVEVPLLKSFSLFSPVKGGECDSLNQVDVDWCTKCIEQNKDMIVGVKVRLSASAANDGANEDEAFRFVCCLNVMAVVWW